MTDVAVFTAESLTRREKDQMSQLSDTRNTRRDNEMSQDLETSKDPWDEIPFGTDADEMAPVEDAAVLSALTSRAFFR